MNDIKIWLRNELLNYDYFSYLGDAHKVYPILLDLIERCQLKRVDSLPDEIKLKKLSNDQIMMIKLSCPVPFDFNK